METTTITKPQPTYSHPVNRLCQKCAGRGRIKSTAKRNKRGGKTCPECDGKGGFS